MSESKHSFLHEIFLKHAHEVKAFISGRWPREQDVADIVQESFLRLSQYPNPEEILNPRAFLFQTASNMAVDRHRRRKTRERYVVAEADEDFEALLMCIRPPNAIGKRTKRLSNLPNGWTNCRNCTGTLSSCFASKAVLMLKSLRALVFPCVVPSVM